MGWDKGDFYEMEVLRQQHPPHDDNKRHKRPLNLPKPVPVIDQEWDDEALRPVDTVYVDCDPGDER